MKSNYRFLRRVINGRLALAASAVLAFASMPLAAQDGPGPGPIGPGPGCNLSATARTSSGISRISRERTSITVITVAANTQRKQANWSVRALDRKSTRLNSSH